MLFLNDLLALFFPNLCAGCNTPLVHGEDILCLGCLADLPKSNFLSCIENPVADIFIGRANIVYGTSFFHFDKGGKVQHLMHQLKYKGRKEVGYKLGLLFGYDLYNSNEFKEIDVIVPVPLHKKKERMRGYNQSVEICKGIAESLGRPLLSGNLTRIKHTSSQTLKGRYERWENVSGIFEVKNSSVFAGKHLLLVDDVVTTGATLEACCQTLLKIPDVRVSIAALANA